MKTKTVLAVAGGVIAGAATGVALCATEFGQKKILMPVMAGKEYLKKKFNSAKEEDDEDEIVEAIEANKNEHIEGD